MGPQRPRWRYNRAREVKVKEVFGQGEIISYVDMCKEEGVSLQKGMNFRLGRVYSVILMSTRSGAPYADRVEEDDRILVYEGHNIPKSKATPIPKTVDQPMQNPGGGLTPNGLFFEAALRFKRGEGAPEQVRVYDKIKSGIWAYSGTFNLIDAWRETINQRRVFKFRLKLTTQVEATIIKRTDELEHDRLIPTSIKQSVWRRDKGRCVLCGKAENLHFDHIIPYSKGGSSLVAENIQLLCAMHNLAKRDKIE